ncbi:hypothetical protein IEO21_00934 [Rhodonia placenta]|uniref:AB hydrolase-1 domain-containing protein n=1 Tax=Rhodonia placenta TaxID=104341 RepID=A0A8H7PAF2_9APHY|nr:hypothetical protein IEO21_00934 [Postia placenta]
MSVSETDGYAPVTVHNAGKPCQTFYKIVGDLSSGKIPLIVLNGGPGSTYTYVFSIKDIATLTDLPVVFYDQIGGGKSTHLPEKNGDVDFWTVQIFVDEFHSLLRHLNIKEYNVLGHSWGAVLGMEIAIRQPAGLRKLVLSSGPVSMELWVQVTRKLLETLPADLQQIIRENEEAKTYNSPEYNAAMQEFTKRFVCRLDPLPEEVTAAFKEMEADPTPYVTMQGPSEFTITGNLKDWSVIDDLHKINVPVLVTNGAHDEAQDPVVAPLFQHVPRVRWYTFANSAHMAHWEEREKYMQVVGDFLTQ